MKGYFIAKNSFVPEVIFKGYLRFKTITSHNVSAEAQVKNFLISLKSYVLFARY